MKYWLFAGYLLLASLSLQAQLDATFNSDGKASVIVGSRVGLSDMLIQPADQKILLGGISSPGGPMNVVLSRFLPTGERDAAFGGGVVSFTFGTLMPAVAFGIQSSGKIIVMMNLDMNNSADHLAALVRLNSDGSMDGSFSTSYVAVPQAGYATTMTIQSDDKIVIAGMGGSGLLVTRLSKDGVIDGTFGSGGVANTTGGWLPSAVKVDANGNICVLSRGTGNQTSAAVNRFTKTGVVDHGFGSNGLMTITVNGNDQLDCTGLSFQSDGNILVAGYYVPASGKHIVRSLIVRLTYNGAYDVTFAGNGRLGVLFPGYNAVGTDVLQDYQGYIWTTGYVTDTATGKTSFGLCVVDPNGVLDTRFGSGGIYVTKWSGGDASSWAIAKQSNGRIVTAGTTGETMFAVSRYINPIRLPTLPHVLAADTAAVGGERAMVGAGDEFGPAGMGVRFFPNPATSTLRVQGLDPQGSTAVVVRDASGKTLMRVKVEQQSEYALDVHRLMAGTYFLQIITGGKQANFPFVKAP